VTKLLVNTEHPRLRIINPQSGAIVQFEGGKLEIEDDDPNHDFLMSVATRRPDISIHVTGILTCPQCNEKFTGGAAKPRFVRHLNLRHPELKAETAPRSGQKRVKVAAQFNCDVCSPVQPFDTADDLAMHAAAVHAARQEEPESAEA